MNTSFKKVRRIAKKKPPNIFRATFGPPLVLANIAFWSGSEAHMIIDQNHSQRSVNV